MAADGERLPYILSGLIIIFLFWSRSLIHTMTVINWPIEFGHNFLYVICTLIEAVLFTQIGDPMKWRVMSVAFWSMAWFIFWFDISMIRDRMNRFTKPVQTSLFNLLEREQVMNVRVIMPLAVAFHAAGVVAMRVWPDALLENRGHLILAWAEFVALSGYQYYVVRFFGRLAPMILGSREEE